MSGKNFARAVLLDQSCPARLQKRIASRVSFVDSTFPKLSCDFGARNRTALPPPPSPPCSFPDEQTGEHRLMRGMAKMRELDIRLARITQRARDLRLQAREAGEEAERAAGTVTGAEVKTPRSMA